MSDADMLSVRDKRSTYEEKRGRWEFTAEWMVRSTWSGQTIVASMATAASASTTTGLASRAPAALQSMVVDAVNGAVMVVHALELAEPVPTELVQAASE